MRKNSYLLTLAGVLSLCAAVFQAVIAFVPSWSAALGAGDALASNPPLLLALGLLVALVLVIFGLYGLSGAGVIRRLPWLRPGLFVIGLLYGTVGVYFIPQVLALLGVLPSARPVPVYQLLVSCGAFVTALAYLLGLAASWKRLSSRTLSESAEETLPGDPESEPPESQSGTGEKLTEDQAADITATWNLLNPP